MNNSNERGIAIVLALFLMSAMSVIAASLMFLSQTETYASMNYRMMSQARYAGEAAVQKASDFLLDSSQYALPGGGDPLLNPGACNRNVSPVTCGGNPVILSAVASQMSSYPTASVQTAFDTAAKGSLAAGNTTVNYAAYATLLSMQVFDSYGGGQSVVQTWQITGIGSLAGSRPATVEVLAIVETPKVPANNFAAFATGATCGAMHFSGNITIDSYDSSVPGGLAASQEESGGDVGTNGNLQIEGSVAVQGNLYSPRVGVGTCEEGAVTALTESGSADVNGSIVQLPTAVTYPLPEFPPSLDRTVVPVNDAATLASACTDLGLVAQGISCTVVGNVISIDGNGVDIMLPSVVIDSPYKLEILGNSIPSQTVFINSLTGDGELDITKTAAGESVVMKVAGLEADNVTELEVPFDLSEMAWKQNAASGENYDASAFQLVYGGSALIKMKGGNSQSALAIYAPNAAFELQGTQDLYGSILARTIDNVGTGDIHYDRRLGRDFYVAGHPMVGTFTWKRY